MFTTMYKQKMPVLKEYEEMQGAKKGQPDWLKGKDHGNNFFSFRHYIRYITYTHTIITYSSMCEASERIKS